MDDIKKLKGPIVSSDSAGLIENIGKICERIKMLEAEKMAMLLTNLATIETLVRQAEQK